MFNQLNPKDIESISRFISFLETISDQHKLSNFVDKLKQDLDALEKANGVYKSLADVEAMKNKVEATLSKKIDDFNDQIEALRIKEKAFEESRKQDRDALQKESEAVSEKANKLLLREKNITELEKTIKSRTEIQDLREIQLKEMEQRLSVLELQLNTKAEQFKTIFGT